MFGVLLGYAGSGLVELPFLFLQAVAVVGMIAVLLLLHGTSGAHGTSRDCWYGVVFGATGLFLQILVSEFIQLASKPYLRSDLLFLGGLMGGWIGAAITLAMISFGRFVFGGGSVNFLAALVDMATLTVAGVVARRFVGHSPERLGLPAFGQVFVVRTIVAFVPTVVFLHLGILPHEVAMSTIGRRISGSPLSLLLMMAIFAMLGRQAQIQQIKEQSHEAARIDPLTGLANRRALKEYLEHGRPRVPVDRRETDVLVLLNIVNIAELTAIHGEEWGNRLWPTIVGLLAEDPAVRDLTRDARAFMFDDTTLGIVLNGFPTEQAEAKARADRLHAAVMASRPFQELGATPKLSMGIVDLGREQAESIAQCLRQLTIVMRDSESRIQFFTHSLAAQAKLDEVIRRNILECIRIESAPIRFQPKIDLRTDRMIGAEALLRMQDTRGAAIYPFRVLEIAARHNLLAEFEWATIVSAVRTLREWPSGLRRIALSVNVSAASMVTSSFGERVAQLLDDSPKVSDRLTIEVTETARLPMIDVVQANFDRLIAAGIRLSLDDFGSGYSALTLLARLPFAEVKVDGWMTSHLDQPRIREAVALAQESAKRYDAALVVEGIESLEQRDLLLGMGIDQGQGFLYSPAIPIEGLHALLCERTVPTRIAADATA